MSGHGGVGGWGWVRWGRVASSPRATLSLPTQGGSDGEGASHSPFQTHPAFVFYSPTHTSTHNESDPHALLVDWPALPTCVAQPQAHQPHLLPCRQEGVFTFPANSWVSSRHGQRIFFEGDAYLPKDTPPALATLRKDALEALRVGALPSYISSIHLPKPSPPVASYEPLCTHPLLPSPLILT